ncbi:MAG: hypothetical protein V4484_01180 [Pseudomonadota bacterium]
MPTISHTLADLQQRGWVQVVARGGVPYAFEKTVFGDVNVLVEITESSGHFTVTDIAEHRCSGPNQHVVGHTSELDLALSMVLSCCKDWDGSESEIDLSKLTIM